MKSRQVKKTLSQLAPLEPREALDERIRGLLDLPGHGEPARTRKTKVLICAACALATALAAVIIGMPWIQTPESIAWAEVEHALTTGLAKSRTMHLMTASYYPKQGKRDYGEIVELSEIWVERPLSMREDTETEIAERLLWPTGDYVAPRVMSMLYNEHGEWKIDHTGRRWAMRTAETNVAGRNPARTEDYMRNRIDFLVEEKFQFPGGMEESSEGVYVRTETTSGGQARVYRFEASDGGWTLCWLGLSGKRLYKVESGSGDEERPSFVYGPIEYDLEPPAGHFEFDPGEEYSNGQLIGLEDQANVINPDLVRMELEDNVVSFYRLGLTSTDETSVPDLRVFFSTEYPGVLNLAGNDISVDNDGRVWGTTTSWSPLGEHYFGIVQLDERGDQTYVNMLSDLERDPEDPAAVEILTYATDTKYCKVAYDANRDGQYDAWARIARPARTTASD